MKWIDDLTWHNDDEIIAIFDEAIKDLKKIGLVDETKIDIVRRYFYMKLTKIFTEALNENRM